MRRINLNEIECSYDATDPEGHRSGGARFGPTIEAAKLGGTVYEIPQAQSICPYHYEYGDEEWAIVVSGNPVLRHPRGEEMLAPGDVVCFPEGPLGAHKLTNHGAEPARVLLLSTKSDPSVAIYPDSDKIGVWPAAAEDRIMVRRSSNVDYFDGEIAPDP